MVPAVELCLSPVLRIGPDRGPIRVDDREGTGPTLEVDYLYVSVLGFVELFGPGVFPRVGITLTFHIDKGHRRIVHVVLRPGPGLVNHDALLVLGPVTRCRRI